MQDRVDPLLEPRALAHDVRPAGDLAPQGMRLLVGQPARGQKAGGQELGEHLGVDLVVFTFASAIALVFAGFETTTRATWHSNSRAIAWVLQVASSATSSVGARLSAKSLSSSGVVLTWPGERTVPSSQIATSANSR